VVSKYNRDGSIAKYKRCCVPCRDAIAKRTREQARVRLLEQKVANQTPPEDNDEERQVRERLRYTSYRFIQQEYETALKTDKKLDKLSPEARRLREKRIGFRKLHGDLK
jgi:hypothetical protein